MAKMDVATSGISSFTARRSQNTMQIESGRESATREQRTFEQSEVQVLPAITFCGHVLCAHAFRADPKQSNRSRTHLDQPMLQKFDHFLAWLSMCSGS